MNARRRARAAGISIIEAMTVVAILGLLVGLAIPSFQRLVLSNRLLGNVNQLLTAVHQARGEALKRNAAVRMCALAPDSAEATCASPPASDWSSGWMVFVDDDADGEADETEEVIAVHHEATPRIDIALQGAGEAVLFRPNGLVVGTLSGTPPRWELCVPGLGADATLAQRGRMVVVNAIGRAETVRTDAKLTAEGFSCV